MKKALFLITVFFITAFASAQEPEPGLFFSEYIEGSGNNKGVEIYNPTATAINLSDYYVCRYSNGSLDYTQGGITQLVGTIQPYTTFVLVNGQTTSTSSSPACSPIMQALADQLDHDYPAPMYMNGNDAIALLKTNNGLPPSGSNTIPVDLIGQIGLGSLISGETGWSYKQDTTLTYNNSNGDPVTGKVINYIVQAKATDNVTFGPFWMSWTSDHSLIRKPEVVAGVVANPVAFSVSMQWDTLPAQLDSTGYYSYKDIWDNLGTHACVADPNYSSAINEPGFNGTMSIYPNPVVSEYFTVSSNMMMKSVQVIDILGNEIYNESFSTPTDKAEVTIGKQFHGIYLVRVSVADNKTITHKILVK